MVSRAGMVQTTTWIVLLPPSTDGTEKCQIPVQARTQGSTTWLRTLDYDVIHELLTQHSSEDFLNDDRRDALSLFTAPRTVQELVLHTWQLCKDQREEEDHPKEHLTRLWELACWENEEILQMSNEDDPRPFCRACQKQADCSHLSCPRHQEKVNCHGVLLREMVRQRMPAHAMPGHPGTRFWGQLPPPPPPLPTSGFAGPLQ